MSLHTTHPSEVTVRLARESDTARLFSLAALDSAPAPQGGEYLIAETEAQIVAALPLGGGLPIADPFRRTAALVQMLELRADQLRAGSRVVTKPRPIEGLRGLLRRWQPHTS
jgi:hypothetical protein